MPDLIMRHVGACIRAERLRRGWSLAETEARSGIKPTTMSSWERAERSMGIDDLIAVARGFGIDPLVLLPGYGELPFPPAPALTDEQVTAHARALLDAGILT